MLVWDLRDYLSQEITTSQTLEGEKHSAARNNATGLAGSVINRVRAAAGHVKA